MNIRSANNKDLSSIFTLVNELGYKIEPSDLETTCSEILASSNQGILVVEDGNAIQGYLAYSIRPQLRLSGYSMEIDELSVSQSSRGKGIGTALLKRAKEIASKLNCKQIIISTNKDRESYKRGFYSKNGFEEKNSAWFKLSLK